MGELERLGGEAWFSLGDLDLATHLYRTQRLHEGAGLATITDELTRHHGVDVRLLPASEDPVATVFTLVDSRQLSFQEYFVKHHHDVAVASVDFAGALDASPTTGVLELLAAADRIVISPSNPLISIQPILAIPGIADVLRDRRPVVVAVSPLIGGRALKGPADRLLDEIGAGASNVGVARAYEDLLGTLLIDVTDEADIASVEALGIRCRSVPTVMVDEAASATLARAVLDA
jgi:LPPG:FO 2-phospho-L-lactate transferase